MHGSDGRKRIASSLRTVVKRFDLTSDAGRSTLLVRKNVHENRKLDKSFKDIEEQKSKMNNSIERTVTKLLIDSEMVQKSSGCLMSEVENARIGLPSVIISRSTTQRSKLPWQKNRRIYADDVATPKYSSQSPATTLSTARKRNVSALPRLQKAMEDAKKHVNEVTLQCKKIPRGKNPVRKMADITRVKRTDAFERLQIKENPCAKNYLKVPDMHRGMMSKAAFVKLDVEREETKDSNEEIDLGLIQLNMTRTFVTPEGYARQGLLTPEPHTRQSLLTLESGDRQDLSTPTPQRNTRQDLLIPDLLTRQDLLTSERDSRQGHFMPAPERSMREGVLTPERVANHGLLTPTRYMREERLTLEANAIRQALKPEQHTKEDLHTQGLRLRRRRSLSISW